MRPRSRGFNIVEVMVALVVISVGLLGIAKMQALSMSSLGTARFRSIAALEAAGLASTVRADRAYWSAVTPTPFTVSFQNGAVTASTDNALLAVTPCISAGACTTPAQITAYDLQDWANALGAQLPNSQATLTCTAAAAPAPVSCTIDINWTENRVGVNAQANDQALGTLATSFRLYVEP
jgi:type IV pilus assembly protein PilV